MLFPWARCEIFRNRHNVAMLAPQWTQPKIGPLLRGERDKRYYTGLFDNSSYVRGIRKVLLLARAKRFAEAEEQVAVEYARQTGRSCLVSFRGMAGFFGPLLEHQPLVVDRLRQILSQRTRRLLEAHSSEPFIGVHVRRGDMPPLKANQVPKKGVNSTLPDAWYVTAIREVRAALGEDLPVLVFSDAAPEVIQDILSIKGVRYADPQPSIVDLFRLSTATVLITTGTSTFSMWAGFIGQMPTIWYPGLREQVHPTQLELEIETDADGALPSGASAVLCAAAQARYVAGRETASS